MAQSKKMSLSDWTAQRPGSTKPRRCACCLLEPEIRDQIDAFVNKVPDSVIVGWLADEYGIDSITGSNIYHHKKYKHHERGQVNG